jgi:hypothetical protein
VFRRTVHRKNGSNHASFTFQRQVIDGVPTSVLPSLVKVHLQVPARRPVLLETLETKHLRLAKLEIIPELGHGRDVVLVEATAAGQGSARQRVALQRRLELRQGLVNVVLVDFAKIVDLETRNSGSRNSIWRSRSEKEDSLRRWREQRGHGS